MNMICYILYILHYSVYVLSVLGVFKSAENLHLLLPKPSKKQETGVFLLLFVVKLLFPRSRMNLHTQHF